MATMLFAYRKGDAKMFNEALAEYEKSLGEKPPADYDAAKVNFEAFFNFFAPFWWAAWLYLVAFVLVAVSWLSGWQPLNRAAFWLVVFTLGLHLFALVSRIYISGRPPVTNLYSSAVFIGFGGVIFGIIFEMIYRIGIGTVVASVLGFSTLLIAYYLSASGDTFSVLVAVLDTQFWLATHVTCVTLGYATTYVAGALGILYILLGVATPALGASVNSTTLGKVLSRMIYGTVCFAMFFSFIGTVLGGLWADDSWGRFWGWDPKENGALIIVLWNALILHARWGGIVKDRGLAALAVAGNIVTSWSWFGVNELGVGLHSYGLPKACCWPWPFSSPRNWRSLPWPRCPSACGRASVATWPPAPSDPPTNEA
jgi:ABC-type transport system involved in cytochrome c biogenesis permease subunit